MSKTANRNQTLIGFLEDPSFKQELRIRAAMKGKTMSELIRDVLRDFVKSEKQNVPLST